MTDGPNNGPELPIPSPPPILESSQPAEEINEGEELAVCPTCDKMRRQFLIVDGKCDSCRTKDQRSAFPNAVRIDWPEVRQRRNVLITDTDRFALVDTPAALQEKYLAFRQRLRDVTDQPDPLAAWRELDVITADMAK